MKTSKITIVAILLVVVVTIIAVLCVLLVRSNAALNLNEIIVRFLFAVCTKTVWTAFSFFSWRRA